MKDKCNYCQSCVSCVCVEIARKNIEQAKRYVHIHNTIQDSLAVHKCYEVAMEIINLAVQFEQELKKQGIEIDVR